MANPAELDLLKDTSEPVGTDNNYFLVTIVDLGLGQQYPVQFRWKFKDGTFGKNWSTAYMLNTPNETVPDEPELGPTDVEGGAGFIKVTWNGNSAGGSALSNIDRVDVHISGESFGDGTKPAGSFKVSGTQTFVAKPGIYIVQLRTLTVNGKESIYSDARVVTVTEIEEPVEPPTNPNGFSINRVLGGIEVVWAGTYANGTFSGFKAVKIYVGNSATATTGTYKEAGVMTGDKVKNVIVVPVDGTYLRYDQPVYIHASAINKNDAEGTLQQNVANNALGARSAISSDLANDIITNAKLVADSVTAVKIANGSITEAKIDSGAVTSAKIATAAITETKIATDAITAPKIAAGSIEAGKIVAGAITAEKIAASAITAEKIQAGAIEASKIATNAITADKIDALAITAEKIAADAITATKIKAGEISVSKLAAGTISVNNLESGTLSATSFIRAGTAGAARVEMSSATISNGPAAGFYIYNSAGVAVLSAPLSGGLSIIGGGTFSGNLSAAGGTFTGTLSAASGSFSGTITATAGSIGGITIAANGIQNNAGTWDLSSGGIMRLKSGTKYMYISPTLGIYNDDQNFYLSITGNSTIAGWTIGTSAISKGTLILSSSLTNGYLQLGSGTSFFKVSDTGLQLGNETFGSAPFRVTPQGQLTATGADIGGKITAYEGDFLGALTVNSGTMKIGKDAGGSGNHGIYFGATADYLYSTGNFRLGNGRMFFNGSTLTIGGATTINGGEITFTAEGTLETDSNNFAGDPTLTLNTSNKITKGRRFIFDGNAGNPPGNAVNFSTVTRTGYYNHTSLGGIDVKTGDILLTTAV